MNYKAFLANSLSKKAKWRMIPHVMHVQ